MIAIPLVGIIDPSHRERLLAEPGRWPRWFPLHEALERATEADPKWSPWTYELLRAVTGEGDDAVHRGDRITVTMLTGGCARSNVIERREDYVDSVDAFYAALRGTLVHRTLEFTARPGSIAEARFITTVPTSEEDVEFSCSPDLITPGPEATIWDYKTTENPPAFDYPYRGHTLQLQFNRYVVNHAEVVQPADVPFDPRTTRFRHLAVVYLGPKGPKVIEVTKSVDWRTPNNKVVKRKRPDIWEDERVLEELVPRLEAMRLALRSYPEWPEGLEAYPGWAGPPTWRCPGPPLCYLPNCLAKRWPDTLFWESPKR